MGCCVFTSELECTARHKPKHAVHFLIDSWPMQKTNTYHLENLFCYQRTKQCAFHAMLMHSFALSDRVKAGPCGAMVDCLTFQLDRSLHYILRSWFLKQNGWLYRNDLIFLKKIQTGSLTIWQPKRIYACLKLLCSSTTKLSLRW